MKKEVREQVEALAREGWRLIGQASSGHIRLEHTGGARIQVANSPSDKRSRLNELARARRRVREGRSTR